jgi:hypothetical protein
MLLRRVAVDNGAGAGAGVGVGRPCLFAVPWMLVGLGAPKCGGPDCDLPTAACSPTTPLHLRPLPQLPPAAAARAACRRRRNSCRSPASPLLQKLQRDAGAERCGGVVRER